MYNNIYLSVKFNDLFHIKNRYVEEHFPCSFQNTAKSGQGKHTEMSKAKNIMATCDHWKKKHYGHLWHQENKTTTPTDFQFQSQ